MRNNESLPNVGDKYIVTDWDVNVIAIIETIKVQPTLFNQIAPEFAEIEGDGYKTLAYRKKVHTAYYKREMEPYREHFKEYIVIICEYFKTIYPTCS